MNFQINIKSNSFLQFVRSEEISKSKLKNLILTRSLLSPTVGIACENPYPRLVIEILFSIVVRYSNHNVGVKENSRGKLACTLGFVDARQAHPPKRCFKARTLYVKSVAGDGI